MNKYPFTGGKEAITGFPLWWDVVKSGDGWDVVTKIDHWEPKEKIQVVAHCKNKRDAEVMANAPAMLHVIEYLTMWVEIVEKESDFSTGCFTIPMCKNIISLSYGRKPKVKDVGGAAVLRRLANGCSERK